MNKIILISGKAESGKTTLAKIIQKELNKKNKNSLIIPFAGYLKFIAKSYFGWSGEKNEEGRKLLQYLGTDIVRVKNPNFWVEVVGDFIELFYEEFEFFIIDDCRFLEEVEYFKNKNINNISIRLDRLNYKNSLTEEQNQHPSETSLDNYSFDLYLQSESGLEKLKEKLLEVIDIIDDGQNDNS